MVTTTLAVARQRAVALEWRRAAPLLMAGGAFVLLFWHPLATLVRDWLHDPDAGHGLLLAPIALYL
ncbi:MAG TPA: hypothetical protein VFS44_05775, partial [Gemmatimonadaceae bacterium]|nr:hypothetical protein [Gemmatimonadaceae bacterium]